MIENYLSFRFVTSAILVTGKEDVLEAKRVFLKEHGIK